MGFAIAICFLVLLSSTADLFADWKKVSASPPIPLPANAFFHEVEVESSGVKVRIFAVLFNEAKCRLHVVDNPPWVANHLENAMMQRGDFAGINGGYFQMDSAPIGLVISDRRILNPLGKARLLSGIIEIRKNSIRLVRSAEFCLSKQVMDALQGGPFLVEHGRVIRGLNDIRAARRTIVASDSHGNWALISMTPLTLAQAGELLAKPDIFPNWCTFNALNLDGGSSTAFWVATKPTPFAIHEFGMVRNFLGLIPQNIP